MPTYKIHPAIGFARVGNSPIEFFIGPEKRHAYPNPPGGFKDNLCQVKRQAARFRIFEYPDAPGAAPDAALAFDPMSGDGLCFALRSGLEAALVTRELLAGDAGAVGRYRSGARQVFNLHLASRALVYRSEVRWKDASFWRGRQTDVRTFSAEA